MRKLFYIAFCLTGMIGFWYFINFLATGVNGSFGEGLFVGVMMTLILAYLANRVERSK